MSSLSTDPNVDNMSALPAIPELDPAQTEFRTVHTIVDAISTLEGEGFPVRRPFPSYDLSLADPFLLLDHMGAVDYKPGEAKGAPDHPHRGFETVTYMLAGAMEHRDSTGGGGVIVPGATQWMTAGGGIVHSEMPPHKMMREGGLMHGFQIWVNLPRTLKMTPPRYQGIEADQVTLLRSPDGGAIIRVIAGELGGRQGPGSTHTPIVLAHATIAPQARLQVAWPREFNALAYVISGQGSAGAEGAAVREGQLAVFGEGQAITLRGPESQGENLNVLLLGGQPIREPVARYGPFVMNTRDEIIQAMADYQSGRMGRIPPIELPAQS
jgi:redox-sensitive bicupin YhaK (pirin superfamily)